MDTHAVDAPALLIDLGDCEGFFGMLEYSKNRPSWRRDTVTTVCQ